MANKTNYFSKKAELCAKAANHLLHMEKYKENTLESIKNSTIYHACSDKIITRDIIPNIRFYDLDSVATAYQVKGWLDSGKTCILNFASYKNPGGRFLEGSSAQEEFLCHHSNLYNILASDDLNTRFYKNNLRNLNNGLYHSNLIYTPDVVFEYVNSTFLCDVITCAAPNKKAAQKYKNQSDDVVKVHMYDRIDHILYAAYSEEVDTIILGAFGCGVFGNNPKEVAEIFKDLLFNKYYKTFANIIFGIPCMNSDDKTLCIFKDVFGYKENNL